MQYLINGFYFAVNVFGIVATALRYIALKKKPPLKVLAFDVITVGFSVYVILDHLLLGITSDNRWFLSSDLKINLALFFTFVREFAERRLNYKRTVINPAQLFIVSFLGIIFIGAFLLTLPNATYSGISFLDALFTSTSAVCVTGLIVVDTATYFTEFGQFIIMILIQIGGLGILTFASYFSYFFKGGSSYENQLSLGEMTNSDKLGEVFSTLKRILIITFAVEFIGGLMIWFSLDPKIFSSFFDKLFFTSFHSVSSFCNAGFSTYTLGLYDIDFRFNYWFQLAIIFLFVMGGLGFPIVVNILKFAKYFVVNKVLFFYRGIKQYRPWVLNLNSRITLITTLLLTVAGTILFFFAEYNNTLAEHGPFGKFVTSLFGATTPRTAGFNTVDLASMNFSTVLLVILLMWVGASPASTGGGIKTSTFAIATLNFISLAKGKTRIEVYRREISDLSVRRAFAVISLSLVMIGFGIMVISITDSEKDLMSIAFECFSAYSTVGLSIGITADLSEPAKLVIIALMFVGRVSMLSILIAVIKKVKHKNYRYPSEEIKIN
jgi:Trk-type K+ transport system membrane component